MSARSLAYDRWLWAAGFALVMVELTMGVGFAPPLQLVAALLFFVVGVPHGALDAELFRRRQGWRSGWSFVLTYVAAACLAAFVWTVSPPAALAGFLALSIWHLGQTDFRRSGVGWAPGLTRGLLVVGLPFLVHPDEVEPVLRAMDCSDLLPPAFVRVPLASFIVFAHGWSVLRLRHRVPAGEVRHEVVQGILLAVMFTVLHPLLAFGLYFSSWHGAAHLVEAKEALGGESVGWARLAAGALPYAVGGVSAVAGYGLVGAPSLRFEDMAGPALIASSALTLPHVVVVEATLGHRSARLIPTICVGRRTESRSPDRSTGLPAAATRSPTFDRTRIG